MAVSDSLNLVSNMATCVGGDGMECLYGLMGLMLWDDDGGGADAVGLSD